MKKRKLIKALFAVTLATAVALPTMTQAVPYASGVTKSGTSVTFILNENADEVKAVLSSPSSTITLSTNKGSINFNLAYEGQPFQIEVKKTAPSAWVQTSDDLNPLMRFFAPYGVGINNNPGSPYFGRIYVMDNLGGTVTVTNNPTTTRGVGRGVYMLNADQTDALGWGDSARTAGLDADPFVAFFGNAASPVRLDIGDDDKVYLADWSNSAATVYRADPDMTDGSGEIVLDGVGNVGNTNVHTTCNAVVARGSQANGNLTIYTIDGIWKNGYNRILKYPIGSGSLPYSSEPIGLGGAGNGGSPEVWSDLDVAPDGKFFTVQFRAAGTAGSYDTNRINLRVYDTDGTTLLWDSLQQSLAAGLTTDALVNSRGVKVSPRGDKVAVIINDTRTWILNMTNGVPDFSTRFLLNTFNAISGTSSTGREVSWDAAGNLFVANRSHEKVRIWSPGGTTTAITGSGGTFQVVVPSATVSVSASPTSVTEVGGTTATFTFTRTGGDTGTSLVVPYTVSGTATAGSDYAALGSSITFAPNATSTNLVLTVSHDTIPELTETVVVTIGASQTYALGVNTATVSILDDETPEVSFEPVAPKKLLEVYANSKVRYNLIRRGLLTGALTVNLSYSGAATRVSDFNAPLSIGINAGAATTNITLTPVDDQLLEGDEIATITVATGGGYNVGVTNSINAIVVDDETAGTPLFSDNFETDSSSQWVINQYNAANSFAEFAWDYGVNAGIPAAPGSATTKGLRMRCGNVVLQRDAISLSPLNQAFSGDYRLRFHAWINYNGPMPDGGPGSTQNFSTGVGTAGNQVIWPDNPSSDGVWFAATGDGADGATGGDYNAFIGGTLQNDDSGVYSAGVGPANGGLRNAGDPFYAYWGGVTAPVAQTNMFPKQTGVANTGNAGMAWHTMAVTKIGNIVTWSIDGIVVATVTNTLTADNVFVGYYDVFATGALSDEPQMSFALVDNLRVETLSAPESPTLSIVRSGNSVTLTWSGSYVLQEATVLTGSPSDWSDVDGNPGTGYSPTATGIKYFRLRSN